MRYLEVVMPSGNETTIQTLVRNALDVLVSFFETDGSSVSQDFKWDGLLVFPQRSMWHKASGFYKPTLFTYSNINYIWIRKKGDTKRILFMSEDTPTGSRYKARQDLSEGTIEWQVYLINQAPNEQIPVSIHEFLYDSTTRLSLRGEKIESTISTTESVLKNTYGPMHTLTISWSVFPECYRTNIFTYCNWWVNNQLYCILLDYYISMKYEWIRTFFLLLYQCKNVIPV